MTWAVKLLQENFNNVPLALDTANKRAIEAGIKVYNRTNGKPIVNSADAGSRISYIDLAAANDAICIALCSADGIAKDNDERMMHCHHMLERGMSLGMEATDLWFDPLFLVVKGMQDKQMDVLNAIKLFSDEGLKSTGGLSNNPTAPEECPPDHGLRARRHGNDAGPDLCHRQPERSAPDGDHQVLRHLQEQRAVLRLLSGRLICQFTVPCCEIPAGNPCIPLKNKIQQVLQEVFMSVLTDLIYGGSHAVAGLTEGAVNDAIAKYGADHPIAFPDTAYFFPTIYAATGVKVKTLGDLPACVGVLKSLITDQEDLGQALNAGLATAVGAEIIEGLKFAEPKDAYEQATVPGIGFVPDPIIRSLGVPLVTGDIPGVAVVLGKADNGETLPRSSRTISPRAS